jgi:hypothetical protein
MHVYLEELSDIVAPHVMCVYTSSSDLASWPGALYAFTTPAWLLQPPALPSHIASSGHVMPVDKVPLSTATRAPAPISVPHPIAGHLSDAAFEEAHKTALQHRTGGCHACYYILLILP